MFKSGEKAIVISDGTVVDVVRNLPKEEGFRHPVLTSIGVLEEGLLMPATPQVVATSKDEDLPPPAVKSVLMRNPLDVVKNATKRLDLSQALNSMKFDPKGHWKGVDITEDVRNFYCVDFTPELAEVLKAYQKGEVLSTWVPLGTHFLLGAILGRCHECGEKPVFESNGQEVRVREACPYPNGMPPVVWDLNVPSGKIVVANDLRPIFPNPYGSHDLGTQQGLTKECLNYVKLGMSHAFVGNSCPSVYDCGNDIYRVASPEDFDKKDDSLATIVTDLWWYSMCDYDEYALRCKHFKVKKKDFHAKFLKVKPGVYRFIHYGVSDEPGHIYSTFEWVRDPDPKVDFLKEYRDLKVTPSSFVHALSKSYPSLYKDQHGDPSWVGVARTLFCSYGNGIEWHEKGFPLLTSDDHVKEESVPHFRDQTFPPLTRGGGYQETLSPDFAEFAFRVLESIISFGTEVYDSKVCREVDSARESMHTAVQRYRHLALKYPRQADPEYVWWLSQEGRAEAWVDNFPLGPTFTQKHEDNIKANRWIPEGTYAVLFDARKMNGGHFSNGSTWASKDQAKGWAIHTWEDNGKESDRLNCCWLTHAKTIVPLYSVARVVKLGTVSHTGDLLVEVAFDYGTPWMTSSMRKAFPESQIKEAGRVLTKEEYDNLLPEAVRVFQGKK